MFPAQSLGWSVIMQHDVMTDHMSCLLHACHKKKWFPFLHNHAMQVEIKEQADSTQGSHAGTE